MSATTDAVNRYKAIVGEHTEPGEWWGGDSEQEHAEGLNEALFRRLLTELGLDFDEAVEFAGEAGEGGVGLLLSKLGQGVDPYTIAQMFGGTFMSGFLVGAMARAEVSS